LVEHWRKGLWQDQAISPYDPEAAEAVLAAVAWWLHGEKNRTTQTVEELGAVATQALADLGPGAGLGRDGVGFIGRMRDQSGILAMWSAGQCGFLHLTFQEYLAGLHAARENRAEELVKNIGASWWREVILVAIAIGSRDFAQKFFAALLETDAVAKQSALVDQCLDEARYAVLEPFLTVLKKPEMAPDRQLAILRPLRPFKHAELTAVCRRLARSAHLELREVAREILQRAGVEPERPTIEILETPLALQVHLKTGIALITIPAGEFVMGSNDGYSDEKPVHCVRISRPFQLGKYPVTNAEYQRFLEANPHTKPPAFWNDSQFNDPQQPVVGVCWHEARAFCQWADGRLPTEAEWEYACRAGSQGHWCFGNDEAKLGEYAWYIQNSGSNLHPVGQKKPNAWGLHDMHGNVWEWCLDEKREYTTEPRLDPVGPLEGAWRVVRGGSYWDDARGCRSAFRLAIEAGSRNGSMGFRLAAGQELEGGAKDSGASGRSRGAEGRSPAEGPESGAG
jgi:formylglycine-generating enzyme required for sulfatase activity